MANTTTDVDPERRFAGLRAHAAAQRQATVERLRVGIQALRVQSRPITARTIWEQTGLAYNSYARNPEAYALYRQASTHLAAWHRRRAKQTSSPGQRDPWLGWSKAKLVTRLRTALQENEQLRAERSTQAAICQEQHGVRIMLLQAQMAAYRTTHVDPPT
jgi:hypothetical protein